MALDAARVRTADGVVRERDEKGAVAPFVAILVVLLVGVASFAVDLGYQRVAARDMQAVADIVALDMARELNNKTTSQLNNSASWTSSVQESVARNTNNTVGDPLKVTTCRPDQTTVPAAQICATAGIYDRDAGTFTDSGAAPATHVRVITRTRIDYFFPVYANDGWVTKTAYAEASDQTCIQIGSYVADANLNKGILGPLLNVLGTRLGLTVGALESLADLDVTLLGLINANVDGVSMSSVLGADVSLGSWYLAIADVAKRETGNTAAVQLLELIAARVSGLRLNLGDVLALESGGTSGLSGKVNVFDLVSFGLAAASGDAGLKLQNLQLPLKNLIGVDASADLVLLQKPQIGCGSRKAGADNPVVESSQLTANVGVTVDLDSGLLKAVFDLLEFLSLGTLRPEVKANVGVELKLVPARAKVTGVECIGEKRKVFLDVSGGRLVELTVNVDARVAINRWTASGWKNALSLEVAAPVLTQPATPVWASKTIDINADGDYDKSVPMGGDTIGLPELNIGKLVTRVQLGDLPGLDLGELLNVLVAPLKLLLTGSPNNPKDGLLGGLDTYLLNPLLQMLGLDVAGFKVKVLRTPECGAPALRG